MGDLIITNSKKVKCQGIGLWGGGGCYNSLSSEYCKQGLSVYYNTLGGIRYYFLLRYIVYNNQDLFTKHYVQILSNCQPNIYFQTAVFAPVVPPCSP